MPDQLKNADHIQIAVCDQLKGSVPADWKIYNRKDLELLNSDEWNQVVYVTNKADVTLEGETDNRELVAYPIPVTLIIREDVNYRDGKDLVAIRREAKQKCYTTNYPYLDALELFVEYIDIQETHGETVPNLPDGFTTAEFLVVIGILEDRSPTP